MHVLNRTHVYILHGKIKNYSNAQDLSGMEYF